MKVIKSGIFAEGTKYNFEYWETLNHYTIAVYPISKNTLPGSFAPKAGETFRYGMIFNSRDKAENCLADLHNNITNLSNYKDRAERADYNKCI